MAPSSDPSNLGIEWDAENRLVAVEQGSSRSEFTYDGLDRRVRMVEKVGGVVQNDTRVLWCERGICQERDASGLVVRRAFGRGEQTAGAAQFFAKDHLGSVTEVTGSGGTLLARYTFDPWGRRTLTTGEDLTTVGFTGHRWQANGELWLALYRGYDPSSGRWLSQDPIGLVEGMNLYSYAAGAPIRFAEPLGLRIACSSSLRFEYDLPETKCTGKPGCTWASIPRGSPKASACEEACGEWKFDGSVELNILVQFATNPDNPNSDSPGLTLAEHEDLHIIDWQEWCGTFNSRHPSEGFSSKGACDSARRNFLEGVYPDFDTNLMKTGEHDKKD